MHAVDFQKYVTVRKKCRNLWLVLCDHKKVREVPLGHTEGLYSPVNQNVYGKNIGRTYRKDGSATVPSH